MQARRPGVSPVFPGWRASGHGWETTESPSATPGLRLILKTAMSSSLASTGRRPGPRSALGNSCWTQRWHRLDLSHCLAHSGPETTSALGGQRDVRVRQESGSHRSVLWVCPHTLSRCRAPDSGAGGSDPGGLLWVGQQEDLGSVLLASLLLPNLPGSAATPGTGMLIDRQENLFAASRVNALPTLLRHQALLVAVGCRPPPLGPVPPWPPPPTPALLWAGPWVGKQPVQTGVGTARSPACFFIGEIRGEKCRAR